MLDRWRSFVALDPSDNMLYAELFEEDEEVERKARLSELSLGFLPYVCMACRPWCSTCTQKVGVQEVAPPALQLFPMSKDLAQQDGRTGHAP